MKNKKILRFQIFSVIFVFILGTLLHFIYEWTNNNLIIGAFSAINESTWEHLKLVFYPMLITTLWGYIFIRKEAPNLIFAKTVGIITAMLFIVIFFYTYTGIIGTNFAILDIGSFFVAVLLGECVSYIMMISNYGTNTKVNNIIATIVLVILFICFATFTYYPPQIQLFKPPQT